MATALGACLFGVTAPGHAQEVTLLEQNVFDGGILESNEVRRFSVEAPTRIDLISLFGDADLEIYESPSLVRLVCSSDSADPVDSCELPGTGRAQIVVEGFERSLFQIRSVSLDTDRAASPRELTVGDAVSSSLRANVRAWYWFDAPGVIGLQSLSGLQTLRVYGSVSWSRASLLCDTSTGFGVSAGNVCDLSGDSGVVQILVLGEQAGNFRLSLEDGEPALPPLVLPEPEPERVPEPAPVPADTDPNEITPERPVTMVSGSGGGGGATGLAFLAALGVALRGQRRRRHPLVFLSEPSR